MAVTAAEAFRDYETDGVPSSESHKIKKSDMRNWGAWVEGLINAFTANGGLIFSSKASLDASLAYAANTMAWVIGDATVANNGVYGKVGASGAGSWTRRADLPFSFIIASDAGAGTANAIHATTSIPVSSSALVWMNIFEANTASPVTVSLNGESALTIKTNSGNDVAIGGLTAGMIVIGIVSGSTFRLVSDQASAAVVAAAEAAQAAAEAAQAAAEAAAAGANGVRPAATRTFMKAFNTTVIKAVDLAEGAPARNGRMGRFNWCTGDFSTQIAADPNEGVYIKADAVASTAGAWVRANWGRGLDPHWFGCVGDGTTDDTSAFQKVIDFIAALNPERKTIWLGNARYLINGNVTIPETGCTSLSMIGNGPYASQFYSTTLTAGDIFTNYALGTHFEGIRWQNDTIDVSAVVRRAMVLTKNYGAGVPEADVDAKFTNCEFSRFHNGVYCKGRGLRVENCLFSVSHNPIALDWPDVGTYTAGPNVQQDAAGFRGFHISGNRFHSNISSAIVNKGTNKTKIVGLTIQNNLDDIGRPLFEGDLGIGARIVGNTITLSPLEGLILTGGKGYLISGNVIEGSEGIVAPDSERIPDNFIDFTGTHDGGVIQNNVFRRNLNHGLDFRSGTFTNMIIQANTFIDPCRAIGSFCPIAFIGANHTAIVKDNVLITSNALTGFVRGDTASQVIRVLNNEVVSSNSIPDFVGTGVAPSRGTLGSLSSPYEGIYVKYVHQIAAQAAPTAVSGDVIHWNSNADNDSKIIYGDGTIVVYANKP